MPRPNALAMTGWRQVLWATFLRDMWIATSYRVGMALSWGTSVLGILFVFFLSEAVGGAATSVERYGGNYFAFVIVGLAFSNLMALGLGGIASRIREAQVMGTLELLLLSPNSLGVLLLGSSLWSHGQALLTLVLYLIVGIALGMDLGQANVPMALAGLLLAILSFNALGLFAASLVLVVKQGNPVSTLIGAASVLLAGVFYPVSVLPSWLQTIAQFLPLTHALEITRRSALAGEGIETLWLPLVALIALTALFLPLGLWVCQRAVRIAQTDGSLSQY
jgi:ABC-2 type transport system permease protein